jgi:hypothetical protein
MRGSQSIRSEDKAVWTRGGGTYPQVREQTPARPVDAAAHDMAAIPPRSKPGRCRGEWIQPMRPAWTLILVAVSLTGSFPLAGEVWAAYGNAPGASPIGQPPSSYEGGLITTPNPLDNSGNLVITGNVGGLKQFQGPIPYSSTTSFGAPLGSTHLDSFLRYSAIPRGTGDYRPAPGYDAFYSPTGTVSAIRPGQASVSAPISPRLAGGVLPWRAEQPPDVIEPAQAMQPQVPTGRTNPSFDTHWDAARTSSDWPQAKTPEQMREIFSGELGRQFADSPASQQDGQSTATATDYQQQLEEFRWQLDKIKVEASQLEQSLAAGRSLPRELSEQALPDAQAVESPTKIPGVLPPAPQSQTPTRDHIGDSSLPSFSPLLPDGSEQVRPSAAQASPGSQADTVSYTSDASAQADRIAALFRPQVPGTSSDAAATVRSRTDNSGELPALQRIRQTAGAYETPPALHANFTPAAVATPDRLGSSTHGLDAASDADVEAGDDTEMQTSHQPIFDQAKPKYRDLDPPAREKFDRYMKAAQSFQQQGQYDRAAESFALASIYGPGESRVYLGRGQALLAAGEYAGSALFLMKAIELDAGRSLAKSDLVTLLGGPDPFIQRITDLEQQANEAADAGELHFLLAYVYHQMDRPAEAKAAIAAAAQAQPHSAAVAALQAAINP